MITPTVLPPELAAYLDEPKQMPSGVVGKNGVLELGFERRDAKSALIHLYRRAPLLVQKALYWDESIPTLPCVFIITTSGCVLQGDRFNVKINLAPDTEAHVTTQSATKIHEMDANYAAQVQDIVLGENSYLEFLPEALIPHKHSRFITNTRVSIPPSATLIYSEILMAGRKYYGNGELFQYDLFSSTVRGERPDGQELFTEKFIAEPSKYDMRNPAVMGKFDVFGNVVVLTPQAHAERIFDQVPAIIRAEENLAAGVSRLPNNAGLVYKILGLEHQPVRAKMREFWNIVRQQVRGVSVPKEFLWR